jgi:hypothetical protein
MIPDDEPWWMVRRNAAAIGDGYGGSSNALPCTCPLADEPASETIEHLNKLPFRPIGYEW